MKLAETKSRLSGIAIRPRRKASTTTTKPKAKKEAKAPSPRRRRRVLTAIVLVGLFLLVPERWAMGKRKAILAHAAVVRQQTAADQQKIAFARQVKAHLATYQRNAATDRALVPARMGLPKLISQLSALAATDGVTWSNASPGSFGMASTGAVGHSLALTVSGPYQAVLTYLSDLQHMPRLITVKSVGLSWQQGTVHASIQASAYTATTGA